MYNLFQRVNAVELLKLALSAYIRATGQGIIMDEEKDKELVPFLLDFKASLDKILEESFAKNEAFSNTIKDSFEHLINLRQVCGVYHSAYITAFILMSMKFFS
jgi:cullin-4